MEARARGVEKGRLIRSAKFWATFVASFLLMQDVDVVVEEGAARAREAKAASIRERMLYVVVV